VSLGVVFSFSPHPTVINMHLLSYNLITPRICWFFSAKHVSLHVDPTKLTVTLSVTC